MTRSLGVLGAFALVLLTATGVAAAPPTVTPTPADWCIPADRLSEHAAAPPTCALEADPDAAEPEDDLESDEGQTAGDENENDQLPAAGHPGPGVDSGVEPPLDGPYDSDPGSDDTAETTELVDSDAGIEQSNGAEPVLDEAATDGTPPAIEELPVAASDQDSEAGPTTPTPRPGQRNEPHAQKAGLDTGAAALEYPPITGADEIDAPRPTKTDAAADPRRLRHPSPATSPAPWHPASPPTVRSDQRFAPWLSFGVIAVLPRAVPGAVAVAVEFGHAGNGWAGAILFNVWLRRKLRERRLSQRQLAAKAGVSHATVSRLLKGDRHPTLATATKLAQAVADVGETEDVVRYLVADTAAARFPTQRVEAALRGDRSLDEASVRYLMRAYLRMRVSGDSANGQRAPSRRSPARDGAG